MLPNLARLVLETDTKRGIDDTVAPVTGSRAKQARRLNFIPNAKLTDLNPDLKGYILNMIIGNHERIGDACQGVLDFCDSHSVACNDETWRQACKVLHLYDKGLRNEMLEHVSLRRTGESMVPPHPWRAAFRILCNELKYDLKVNEQWMATMGRRPSQRKMDLMLDLLLNSFWITRYRTGPLVFMLERMGAMPGRTDHYRRLDKRLRDAVETQNVVEVRNMLNTDADVNDVYNMETVLISASAKGHIAVVNVLLTAPDIDVNQVDFFHATALTYASVKGHVAVVKALLGKGADPNMQDNDGEAALAYASRHGKVAVINALLDRGASINMQDIVGETALSMASWYNKVDAVVTLLQRGALIDLATKKGYTPLMQAIAHGVAHDSVKGHAVVNVLLNNGADVDAVTKKGGTALMLACLSGNVANVNALLAKRADVNMADREGKTALMYAIRSGNGQGSVEIVQLLLTVQNIDVNRVNNAGDTALMIARRNDQVDIVRVLLTAPGIRVT